MEQPERGWEGLQAGISSSPGPRTAICALAMSPDCPCREGHEPTQADQGWTPPTLGGANPGHGEAALGSPPLESREPIKNSSAPIKTQFCTQRSQEPTNAQFRTGKNPTLQPKGVRNQQKPNSANQRGSGTDKSPIPQTKGGQELINAQLCKPEEPIKAPFCKRRQQQQHPGHSRLGAELRECPSWKGSQAGSWTRNYSMMPTRNESPFFLNKSFHHPLFLLLVFTLSPV